MLYVNYTLHYEIRLNLHYLIITKNIYEYNKIGSLLPISLTTLSIGFAMDNMMDEAPSSTMKDSMKVDSMMKTDSMMKDTKDMTVTMHSSKEDITKLQMMLVEKGFLVMPRGAAYGYYGNKTKTAQAKHKKMSTMMDAGKMKTDSMKKDSMMKDDIKKEGTTMSH